jgi:hypothetical protein
MKATNRGAQTFEETVIEEVRHQCSIAILAARRLEDTRRENNDTATWLFLSAFLSAAANISKWLWPTRPRKKELRAPGRGEYLRRVLAIPEKSPLRCRKLRDHLEHFDERLEKWNATATAPVLVDRNVGDLKDLDSLASPEGVLRNFDSERWVVTFHDERYEIRPLYQAIAKLQKAAATTLPRAR